MCQLLRAGPGVRVTRLLVTFLGSQLDKPRLFLVATNRVHVNIAVIINAIVLYILVFMYLLEIKLLLLLAHYHHICGIFVDLRICLDIYMFQFLMVISQISTGRSNFFDNEKEDFWLVFCPFEKFWILTYVRNLGFLFASICHKWRWSPSNLSCTALRSYISSLSGWMFKLSDAAICCISKNQELSSKLASQTKNRFGSREASMLLILLNYRNISIQRRSLHSNQSISSLTEGNGANLWTPRKKRNTRFCKIWGPLKLSNPHTPAE